ncbi:MAG TPA: aspartate/glutamate racemase family protein, partial [Rhizobiaceae bacterium]|nr:aspartate/glutamate racemase family protein [Rhizobiaceae bacterium]
MNPHILLINPNSSRATSEMMLAIARRVAAGRVAVVAATATRNPEMIVTARALEASVDEVVEMGLAHAPGCQGIIVSAYGDPGVNQLKER